uniref:Putative isopenicillin-n-synthase n=1 Tax=Thalassocalyce inconstans TaxID=140487 RepID=A0A0A0S1S5_THAIN|nr:putative isopenicillin-n-synthase [Thalassocalyce inconstans]
MFKLLLLLGVFSVPAATIDLSALIEQLWPNESTGVFDSVAKIPYTDLLNDNPYVDPFVLHSMKTYGFFYVVDVPNYSAEAELELMTTFFGLPEDVKADVEIRAHNPANANAYRGYCPGLDDIDATLQYKNIFNIGPHETRAPFFDNSLDDATEKLRYDVQEPNVWPNTDNCDFDKEFKETFQAGFELRRGIARAFVRSISRSLEMPALPSLFTEDEFSAMGLRKYPERNDVNTNMYSDFDGELLRELEHVDSTVTVLSTFENSGLQMLYRNEYRDAPNSGNGFIVNIGKLVDDIIDNELVSVRHRVKEVSFDRYSITYFLGPSFDADISRSMSGEITEAGHKYTIFGEWIKDYLGAIELFYY